MANWMIDKKNDKTSEDEIFPDERENNEKEWTRQKKRFTKGNGNITDKLRPTRNTTQVNYKAASDAYLLRVWPWLQIMYVK